MNFDVGREKVVSDFATAASSKSAREVFGTSYERLRKLARRERTRGGRQATLDTTELVHESYLRIVNAEQRFETPRHFFAYAARVMRHVLVDKARRLAQRKRGGDLLRVDMDNVAVDAQHVDPQLALTLDAALDQLSQDEPRAAQVVELHYFAGLDLQRVADTLQIARRTADRDWRYARAFLAARSDLP